MLFKKKGNSIRKSKKDKFTPKMSLFRAVAKPVINARYNVKLLEPLAKADSPVLILGNHPSNLDPFIAGVYTPNKKMRILSSNFYFRIPVAGKFLNSLGAIPKQQFSSDIRSMKAMLQAVANGYSLLIFPEGRRSICGEYVEFSDAIAKFAKKLSIPVWASLSHGSYMSWPRWAKKSRRGKITTDIKCILSADEVKNLSVDEIYTRIKEGLYYNDYEWNRSANVKFRNRKVAEGIENILYMCPKCKGVATMQTKGKTLYCTSCSNTAIMDQKGFLHPSTENDVVFDSPVDWYHFQEDIMREAISAEDFSLTATIFKIKKSDPYIGKITPCTSPSGTLTLDKTGLTFKGTIDNNEETTLFFPISSIPALCTAHKNDIEISDKLNTWYFYINEKQMTVQMDIAATLLHRLQGSDN